MPDPLILGLLAVIGLATIAPATGVGAMIVDRTATAAIILLFFFHGAKLSRTAVLNGIKHWRLHILVLGFTFIMFPAMGLGLASVFSGQMPPALWTGILFLSALPSTVQSSIAFTSIARGNVAAAVASASASQFLGVFLTPLLVGLLAGAHGGYVPVSGLGKLVLQILVPFALGHALHPWLGPLVSRYKATIALTDRATILLAVYSAFSLAVIEGLWTRLPLSVLCALLAVCCLILAIALLATGNIAKMLGFNRSDRITILFCGTKKSLVQGIPMARVLFPGPDLGLILLPIMIFHQLQLMACAWIARRYAKETENV